LPTAVGAQLNANALGCSMPRMIELHSHGLHLELTISGPPTDEDWLRATVRVEVPGFAGEYSCQLQTRDLERFAVQLENMHRTTGSESTAELSSAEPGIRIVLRSNRFGQVGGLFELESQRPGGVPTLLSGPFEMDQSYLPGLVRSIMNAVHELRAA
jgi:hypothetical protein